MFLFVFFLSFLFVPYIQCSKGLLKFALCLTRTCLHRSGCPCLLSAGQALGAERKSDLGVYPDAHGFQGQPSKMTNTWLLRREPWVWGNVNDTTTRGFLSLLCLRERTSCFLLGSSPSSTPSLDPSNMELFHQEQSRGGPASRHPAHVLLWGTHELNQCNRGGFKTFMNATIRQVFCLCCLWICRHVKAGLSVAILWLWGDKLPVVNRETKSWLLG